MLCPPGHASRAPCERGQGAIPLSSAVPSEKDWQSLKSPSQGQSPPQRGTANLRGHFGKFAEFFCCCHNDGARGGTGKSFMNMHSWHTVRAGQILTGCYRDGGEVGLCPPRHQPQNKLRWEGKTGHSLNPAYIDGAGNERSLPRLPPANRVRSTVSLSPLISSLKQLYVYRRQNRGDKCQSHLES